jgi:hypothetical protein
MAVRLVLHSTEHALVAQWREQRFPKPRAEVRFLPGAHLKSQVKGLLGLRRRTIKSPVAPHWSRGGQGIVQPVLDPAVAHVLTGNPLCRTPVWASNHDRFTLQFVNEPAEYFAATDPRAGDAIIRRGGIAWLEFERSMPPRPVVVLWWAWQVVERQPGVEVIGDPLGDRRIQACQDDHWIVRRWIDQWQVLGNVPIDTGLLALVDPMNADDVSLHEMDEPTWMTYQVVTNEHGISVAVLLGTGLGDGVYPVEARFEEAEGAMRIAEVRVRFLPHPVIGYQLPR